MYRRVFKRWLDVLLALLGLIVFALPMLVIALVIVCEDPGPAVFRQSRVGRGQKRFRLLKFRTMRRDSPPDLPKDQLAERERYMLRCGRTLRRFSLDELPQLVNILRGEMSVVGPRPLIGLRGEEAVIRERERLGANDVRPGLTGLAQISGRDRLGGIEKARLDGEYVRRMSFGFDLGIVLRTVGKVVTHEGFAEDDT